MVIIMARSKPLLTEFGILPRSESCGTFLCVKVSIIIELISLQKHAKTHSNLRPYTCRYCAFAFKTKGNLTKHMKSKAHHKKCVEIGVVPVPTNVEDLAYLSPEGNNALSRVSLKLSLTAGFFWTFFRLWKIVNLP